MNMHLKKSQQDWLETQVLAGRFQSLDEAVATAIARLQADDIADDAWTKPLIDEAVTALDQGHGSPWRRGDALKKIKARRSASP